MLPTPATGHVPYDRVYEPAEDSYLLLDTLSSELESSFLHTRFRHGPSPLVYELGSGSGVVIAFVAAHARPIVGRADLLVLASDINSTACEATYKTISQACLDQRGSASASAPTVTLASINANLTDCIRPGTVDIFIFNPPYVPAPLPDMNQSYFASQFEKDSYFLSLSYAGGQDGMQVTSKVLEQLPALLTATRGVAYILLCAQNKPRQVVDHVLEWQDGWTAEVVGSSGKQAGWEKLTILRIYRRQA